MDICLNLGLRLSFGSRLSFSVNLGLGVSHKPVFVRDPASFFFPSETSSYFFKTIKVPHFGQFRHPKPSSMRWILVLDPSTFLSFSFGLALFSLAPKIKKRGGVLAHLLLSSWGCQKLPALRPKNCLSSVYVPSSTLRRSFAPAQKKHTSLRPIFSAFKGKILCKICQTMVQFGFGLAPQSLLTFFSMGSLRTIIPVSNWLNIFSYLH